MCRAVERVSVSNPSDLWVTGRSDVFPLTHAYETTILMHMRTTLILDDKLLEQASRLSGIEGKTAVVHAGLRALVAQESARRLARLGGTERRLQPIPRRRGQEARHRSGSKRGQTR